jgi:hypothetical protein
MIEFSKHFPVSEYLRDSILDARTISNTGVWWTACLAIKDPRSKKVSLVFYKWQWQKKTERWVNKQKIKLNSLSDVNDAIAALGELSSCFGAEN